MRLCTSLLTTLWMLLIVPTGWSSDAVETTPVTNAFKNLAETLRSQKPWQGWEPSKAEQQSLDQLKHLADTLMKQPDYSVAMLNLLDTYRTEDGLPRQQLLDAIVESSRVQTSDVPFYKQVFLASLNFTYDDYPLGQSKYWYTPSKIRTVMAGKILNASGQPGVVHNPDVALISGNPKAWIAKYAP